MYTRRRQRCCCCCAKLFLELVAADKVEKIVKGEVKRGKDGAPIMVDKVLAKMPLMVKKKKKKGACRRYGGCIMGNLCGCCNKCCWSAPDLFCEGMMCVLLCPCKLYLCLNPPDKIESIAQVNNKDWEMPVTLIQGRIKAIPKKTIYTIDDKPCVTYVPYVNKKKLEKMKKKLSKKKMAAQHLAPGATLFKVGHLEFFCVLYARFASSAHLPALTAVTLSCRCLLRRACASAS